MSCFIVEKHCIDDVVTLIKNIVDNTIDCNEVGKELYNLNIESYNYRYDANQPYCNKWNYVESERSELEQYCNMRCLDYQCEQEIEKTKAYQKYMVKYRIQIETYLYNKYIHGKDSMSPIGEDLQKYCYSHNVTIYWGE